MKRSLYATLIVFVFLALAPAASAAEAESPPVPPAPGRPGITHTSEGLWISSGDAVEGAQTTEPQTTGGPDDYGYTWDDAAPLGWIDASGGADTGLSPENNHTGPIDIGFSFKYYENTYTQVYISLYGFLTFQDTNWWWNRQSRVPSPEEPNNVISPHWVPIDRVDGYIRYLRGGTEPNRWLVVEWNQAVSDCCGNDSDVDRFTFEAVLHESGDIDFQYLDMTLNGSYYCMSSGIEDARGLDGLMIADLCQQVSSNHAVTITRPPASARVAVYPRYQGRFTQAGAVERFAIPLRNTGELGEDTYDVTVSSPWPASLIAGDGVSPMVDTDGDGAPDTYRVPQGSGSLLHVDVQTPFVVNVGDSNEALVTLRSSVDPSKNRTASLRTAIPAPFAQIYYDGNDGAMRFDEIRPNRQTSLKVTEDGHYGFDVAVAETPNSFFYIWSKSRRNSNDVWVTELEYSLLDHTGRTSRPVTRLTNYENMTFNARDYEAAASVTPEGRIGILWRRYNYDSAGDRFNQNIYFVILDAAGNVTFGPVNLTQNAIWGNWNDDGVPNFWEPRIAATKDNRLVLIWRRYVRQSDRSISDIYVAVRDGNGGDVKGVTRLTDAAGAQGYYYSPTVTGLENGRVFLAYANQGRIEYRTLDSAGNTPAVAVGRASNVDLYGYAPDAVQLSGGRIALVWTNSYNRPFSTVTAALLDNTGGSIVAGPVELPVPRPHIDSYSPSVAKDESGNAIITWSETSTYRDLYYALLDSNGHVRTPATIFQTSQATNAAPRLYSSWEGHGNTSNTVMPSVAGVDAYVQAPPLSGAPPGGQGTTTIQFGNQGISATTRSALTVTLASGLTFVGATPPPNNVAAAASGETALGWSLPSLDFLGYGKVLVTTGVPSTTIGARHPMTVTLSAEGDRNPANDSLLTEIMEALMMFLSTLWR